MRAWPIAALIIFLTGCAAPKSAQHSAILEWHQEGHYVYKKTKSKEYFVRCADGEKYVGYRIPRQNVYRAYGPVDVCKPKE